MATNPQPSGPFQKIENPTALNYDALYDAGYSNYDIAKALGVEHNKNVDAYLEQGGNINDFLYVYSNAAEPGSLSAFTDRLLRSLSVSAPTTAAVVGGAKLGKKVPFAQPLPTIAGAIGGGLLASKGAEQAVEMGEEYGFFETNPPLRQDRFAAIMGDVIGESLPMVFAAPYFMTNSTSTAGFLVSDRLNKLGGRKGSIVRAPGKAYTSVEEFLSRVGQTARGEKGKVARRGFYGVETAAAGTSALGGATAREGLGTGETGQLAGEVIGGMFEPRLVIARQLPKIFGALTGKLGTEARETALGSKIRQTLLKYGEEPEQIIRELEENPQRMSQFLDDLQVNVELPPLTPAQITNSPVLSLLQNTVAKKSATTVLDQEAAARADKGYEFIEQMAQALIAQGDAESIRLATELRVGAIADLVEQAFINANEAALGSAARLGRNDDFDVIGKNLKENFDRIITNANAQEAKLWNEIPDAMEVPIVNLFDRVEEIKAKYLLETEDFPKNIASQIELFKGRLGLTDAAPTANKAVAKAQSAVNALPAPAVKDYEDVLATITDPQRRRMYLQGAEATMEETVDPDFALSKPVRVLDAIRLRRQRFGKTLSAGEKQRLAAAERVANAELKLLKAQSQAGMEPTEDAVGSVNVKQLYTLRSRALDGARKAMKDGDRGTATALGELASAILRELDQVAEGGDAAYDTARAFSRGKNDALRRTFLGDIMARNEDGGELLEPSLLPNYLFEGGADATAMRFREIQDGAQFVQNKLDELDVDESLRIPADDLELGPVNEQSLQTALTKAVQYAASDIIDPATGRINPRKAAAFLQDNEILLRSYPDLREMIQDGRQFEDMVKLIEKRKDKIQKAANSNHVLAKVLRYESPPVAISEALGGPRPVTNLETVIRTVKRAMQDEGFAAKMRAEGYNADEAMDGLKSAMVEWMWTKAGGSGGKFNFAAAREAMFKPLTKGRTGAALTGIQARSPEAARAAGEAARERLSVADVLKKEGVFTQAELDRLDFLLENGQRIQSAQRAGTLSEEMVEDLGFTADLLMRLAGARFGTDVASMTGMQSNSLITGGAGVRFVKNMFGKKPAGLQLNILEQAVLDPEMMVKLLKKGETAAEQEKAAAFLNAYLISAGLSVGEEDDVSPGPDVEIDIPLEERGGMGLEPYKLDPTTQGPSFQQRLQQAISPVSEAAPSVPPRGPSPAPLAASAPSASMLAQAPSSPDTARRMAAAFPGDGIMGLMAMRG